MTGRFSKFNSISYTEDRHELRMAGTKCRLSDMKSGTGEIFISGAEYIQYIYNMCNINNTIYKICTVYTIYTINTIQTIYAIYTICNNIYNIHDKYVDHPDDLIIISYFLVTPKAKVTPKPGKFRL